jgi:hypothetical protein
VSQRERVYPNMLRQYVRFVFSPGRPTRHSRVGFKVRFVFSKRAAPTFSKDSALFSTFILASSAPARWYAQAPACEEPVQFTCPHENLLMHFLPVPLYGDEDSPEARLTVSRQGSAARDLLTGDRGQRPEILGYWKRSAAVGDAVSKSALISRELSLNKPGPGRVNSLEGAPSNDKGCARGNFIAAAPGRPQTDN